VSLFLLPETFTKTLWIGLYIIKAGSKIT